MSEGKDLEAMAASPWEDAVRDASQAFLGVMDLHGYGRKGDLACFIERMQRTSEFDFHRLSGGAHPDAHGVVTALLVAIGSQGVIDSTEMAERLGSRQRAT